MKPFRTLLPLVVAGLMTTVAACGGDDDAGPLDGDAPTGSPDPGASDPRASDPRASDPRASGSDSGGSDPGASDAGGSDPEGSGSEGPDELPALFELSACDMIPADELDAAGFDLEPSNTLAEAGNSIGNGCCWEGGLGSSRTAMVGFLLSDLEARPAQRRVRRPA